MTDKQLSLLSWKPPVQVIPFPLANDVRRVRRTAQVLSQKTGRDAEAYWARITDHLGNRLLKATVPEQTVKQELEAFTAAVSKELLSYPSFDD